MNIYLIIILLFIHWVADFVCQTHYVSINKSKSLATLLEHTGVYTFVWFIAFLPLCFIESFHVKIFWFLPITFFCHTVTDYYTSRVHSQLWEDKKVHEFFVSIGLDQFLHFSQIFLTFYFLTK